MRFGLLLNGPLKGQIVPVGPDDKELRLPAITRESETDIEEWTEVRYYRWGYTSNIDCFKYDVRTTAERPLFPENSIECGYDVSPFRDNPDRVGV